VPAANSHPPQACAALFELFPPEGGCQRFVILAVLDAPGVTTTVRGKWPRRGLKTIRDHPRDWEQIRLETSTTNAVDCQQSGSFCAWPIASMASSAGPRRGTTAPSISPFQPEIFFYGQRLRALRPTRPAERPKREAV